MKRLEKITHDYWMASKALRHPNGPNKTVEDVLKLTQSSDRLRPEEWRLSELIHVVRFDIIEGDTKWRETQKQCAGGSILMWPTTD